MGGWFKSPHRHSSVGRVFVCGAIGLEPHQCLLTGIVKRLAELPCSGSHSGFEPQRRHHHKFKTGLSGGPTKRTSNPSNDFNSV